MSKRKRRDGHALCKRARQIIQVVHDCTFKVQSGVIPASSYEYDHRGSHCSCCNSKYYHPLRCICGISRKRNDILYRNTDFCTCYICISIYPEIRIWKQFTITLFKNFSLSWLLSLLICTPPTSISLLYYICFNIVFYHNFFY